MKFSGFAMPSNRHCTRNHFHFQLLPVAIAAVSVLCSPHASAQPYPSKPVRLVVPFAPGGGTDLVARMLASKLSAALKEQVVVGNRPGAATQIGSEIVAKALPDGYSLLLCALPHATNPSLYPKLPYDTKKDFAPITLAARVPSVMLVTATSPAKSVAELIALSKTGRGVNYSSPGNGTAAHLGMELFKLTSGLNAQQISYKGAGPQVTALIAGEVEVAFATISTSKPHVMSGRLRALAVASGKRAVQLPNVPALAEVGYPGLDIYAWFGLLAPADTPRPVVQRLNQESNVALNLPDVRAAFEADGVEAMPGTIEQFAKYIDDETARWGKVIKQAAIKPD